MTANKKIPRSRKTLIYPISCTLALAVVQAVSAETLLPGGDFEAGAFTGWTAGASNGGRAFLAMEGECFSVGDTSGIQLDGSYAALLRSNAAGEENSSGSITSDLFTAGSALTFVALSELPENEDERRTADLKVAFINNEGTELLGHTIAQTNVVTVSGSCTSNPTNGAFHGHLIDTRLILGQQVRVRFSQSTRLKGFGVFTLVDNVSLIAAGETPIMRGPVAQGGTTISGGRISLDASRSYHENGIPLNYEWFVSGETIVRSGESARVDDLEGGNYEVVLVASDGFNYSSDLLTVGLPDQEDEDTDEDGESTVDETVTGGVGGTITGNDPPTISSISDLSVTFGSVGNIVIAVSDLNNDPITVSTSTLPSGMTLNATSNQIFYDGTTAVGVYGIIVRASDEDGSANEEFTFSVTQESGTAPALASIANITVDSGVSGTVGFSITEPDNDTVTITSSSLPSGVTLDTSNQRLNYSGTTPAGTFAISITVTDKDGSDTETFTFKVNPDNQPPALAAISNVTVANGASGSIPYSAAATDGDAVTVTTSTLPTGVTLNLANSRLDYDGTTPNGAYNIAVIATDTDGSDTESFVFTVQ